VKGKSNKPHFNVTAGLIWKNGKVLIAKRPKGSHLEGYWEFAGGKQEEGESLKDCLEREIEEELGVKIKADQLFLTVKHEYRYKVVSLHTFNCTILAGEPMALKCQELRWVYPTELDAFNFPPPDMQVIKAIYHHSNRMQVPSSSEE
jgi:8-oxo-dGTP diphosphatase